MALTTADEAVCGHTLNVVPIIDGKLLLPADQQRCWGLPTDVPRYCGEKGDEALKSRVTNLRAHADTRVERVRRWSNLWRVYLAVLPAEWASGMEAV